MDIYMEHIVVKKKGIKEYLLIAAIFLVTVILMSAAGLFLFSSFGSIAFIATIGIVAGSYYLITSFNMEYEYIFTNGELDIDSISNRRKRKRLITISAKNFDIVAPVGTSEFANEENASFTRVINVASFDRAENAYFAVFSKDGQRIKLIFEPTEKMLESFKIFAPKSIHTK